jgi:hypothetical protein
MMQWLDEHPQYLPVQLFIGGNSYSGMTVPQVTKKVIDGKIVSCIEIKPFLCLDKTKLGI